MRSFDSKLSNVKSFQLSKEAVSRVENAIDLVEIFGWVYLASKYIWSLVTLVSFGYLISEIINSVNYEAWTVFWQNKSVLVNNMFSFIPALFEGVPLSAVAVFIGCLSLSIISITAGKLTFNRINHE